MDTNEGDLLLSGVNNTAILSLRPVGSKDHFSKLQINDLPLETKFETSSGTTLEKFSEFQLFVNDSRFVDIHSKSSPTSTHNSPYSSTQGLQLSPIELQDFTDEEDLFNLPELSVSPTSTSLHSSPSQIPQPEPIVPKLSSIQSNDSPFLDSPLFPSDQKKSLDNSHTPCSAVSPISSTLNTSPELNPVYSPLKSKQRATSPKRDAIKKSLANYSVFQSNVPDVPKLNISEEAKLNKEEPRGRAGGRRNEKRNEKSLVGSRENSQQAAEKSRLVNSKSRSKRAVSPRQQSRVVQETPKTVKNKVKIKMEPTSKLRQRYKSTPSRLYSHLPCPPVTPKPRTNNVNIEEEIIVESVDKLSHEEEISVDESEGDFHEDVSLVASSNKTTFETNSCEEEFDLNEGIEEFVANPNPNPNSSPSLELSPSQERGSNHDSSVRSHSPDSFSSTPQTHSSQPVSGVLEHLRSVKTPRRVLSGGIDFDVLEKQISRHREANAAAIDICNGLIDGVIQLVNDKVEREVFSVLERGFIFMKGLGKKGILSGKPHKRHFFVKNSKLKWKIVGGNDSKVKSVPLSDISCLIRGHWHGGSDTTKLPLELRDSELLLSLVCSSRTLDLAGFSSNDCQRFIDSLCIYNRIPVIDKRKN
ncbi:hypothetical protein P9112_004833 [Eukaryota sp. TZLM1-RC]